MLEIILRSHNYDFPFFHLRRAWTLRIYMCICFHLFEILAHAEIFGLFHLFTLFLEEFGYTAGSVRVAERLALPTSDHGVAGSTPARGEILSNLNGASLHRAFHIHPSTVPI